MDAQQQVKKEEVKVESSDKNTAEKHKAKELPPCSRCKKKKKVAKHHYPVGSRRMAYLCFHCYEVVKRQRKRAKKFGHW